MKLVVGLGNPGRRYQGTRHNVGYMILAELAKKFGLTPPRERFHGEVVEADLGGSAACGAGVSPAGAADHRVAAVPAAAPPGGGIRALLLSPTTFMNLSGASVQEAMSFYKLPNHELLVLCDDLNLPLGKLRFRAGGSAGGQKGLDDIIARLGTEEFSRLRLGIGPPPDGWDWADYVLSKFRPDELPAIEQAVGLAAEAVVTWARKGIEHCTNQYNR